MGKAKKNVVAIAFCGILMSTTAASAYSDKASSLDDNGSFEEPEGNNFVLTQESDTPVLDSQNYLLIIDNLEGFAVLEDSLELENLLEKTFYSSEVIDVLNEERAFDVSKGSSFNEKNIDKDYLAEVGELEPMMNILSNEIRSGSELKFAVEDFPADEDIVVSIRDHVFIDDIKKTDSTGALNTSVLVPEGFASGDSNIRLSGDGFTFSKDIVIA